MKKRISLVLAMAMALSAFAPVYAGAEEAAASTGASVIFNEASKELDSIEITADNLTEDALAALNVKDADGNYSTEPVDINGWTFQRTIPDGTNTAQAMQSSTTWRQKNWLIINKFAKLSNNIALPELNSPFSIGYDVGTNSNNSYVEFGDIAGGNYYRMNFRLPTGATTVDGTTYYNNVVRVQRYDNGTVAFTKDVVVEKRTTKYGTFRFTGTIKYDGTNLILTQAGVDNVVNTDWENWEMWQSRVSGNVIVGTGNCMLYLNKLVITSEAQATTVNDFILNRTFTSADTEAALEAEGWNVTMNSASTTANALAATQIGYDVDIAGDYTVEIDASKEYNNTYIYLRYDKATQTGYAVWSKLSSGNFVSIGKVENGKYVEKKNIPFSGYYDKGKIKYIASVADVDNGVEVSLEVVESANKTTKPQSWVDEKTEDNEPIKSGGFLYKNQYAGKTYVSSVKVYPTATGSKEVSDVDVKYLMKNAEIETIEADGAVYMKMPTAILGQDFTVICALYEDGVMKGVTQVAPIEAYNSNGVKLFDTTGLSGEVSVETFIWSGIDNMEALATSKELK